MIENIRERLDRIDTHIDKADAELMPVFLNMRIAEGQESNLDVFGRLEDTLDKTLVTLSAMATHYQSALEHRRTAEEAITASGISVETDLGKKVLDAVSHGADTMDRIARADNNSIGLADRLEGFKYQLIAYKGLERRKVAADDKVRENIGACSDSLQIATNTTTNLKKVL